LGRGDFLLVAKGDVIRFQAAYATEEEMVQATLRIRSANASDTCGWQESAPVASNHQRQLTEQTISRAHEPNGTMRRAAVLPTYTLETAYLLEDRP
jgi:hypothetical protein